LIEDGKYPQAPAPVINPFFPAGFAAEDVADQGCWPQYPWLEVFAQAQK